jgi:hypothetical protein
MAMKAPDEQLRNSMMQRVEAKGVERLPWHRPEFKRLHVALDTAIHGGSGDDGTTPTGDAFPPP